MKFVLVKLSDKISTEFCERVMETIPEDWERILVTEKDQLMEALRDCDYFMGWPVPLTFFKRNQNLKGVFLLSSQVPQSYQKLDVEVLNITGLNSKSVSDHALYLALKAIRDRELALDTEQLNVGIMGRGAIGTRMLQDFQGLFPKLQTISRKGGDFDYTQYSEFLQKQDLIFISLSYSNETKELFSQEKFFDHLKKEIIIVNIARGELFEERDLYQFFSTHPEAKYMTDVMKPEPYPEDGVMRSLNNVFITEHVGGFDSGLWSRVLKKWKKVKWIN